MSAPDGSISLFAPDLTNDAAEAELRLRLRVVAAEGAAFEARVMLEDATGLGRTALRRAGARPLGAVSAATLDGWLARRLTGEPLWRVVGTREFRGLRFAITPAVLDPRPDTETVVDAVLAAVGDRGRNVLRVLDLGTGSGALLGALLSAWPRARGWGVDLSFAACRVAAANLQALGLSERALVVNADWVAALAKSPFDVIVSNPPYIETAVIPTLASAVRDFDPHLALDGGPDGLAAYRTLATVLPGLLRPGGVAALEVGIGQAPRVVRLLEKVGAVPCVVRRDLGGVDRVVVVGA